MLLLASITSTTPNLAPAAFAGKIDASTGSPFSVTLTLAGETLCPWGSESAYERSGKRGVPTGVRRSSSGAASADGADAARTASAASAARLRLNAPVPGRDRSAGRGRSSRSRRWNCDSVLLELVQEGGPQPGVAGARR